MKRPIKNTLLLTLTAGLAFSPMAASAEDKAQYQADGKTIEADARVDRSSCNALSQNAKDVCVAEAKGKEQVARAELEARNDPSPKNRTAVQTAKAEAAYEVSMERCDDRAGNQKDVCVQEAKAAKVSAMADAESQAATSKANKSAQEQSASANAKASAIGNEARTEAAGDKADAGYAVAKEKCNGLAGDSKDNCMTDAKARFGQR